MLHIELQYPSSVDYKKTRVFDALKNTKYEQKSGQVPMLISENIVMIELRHYLESNCGFDSYV